jgi:hypothetical protein
MLTPEIQEKFQPYPLYVASVKDQQNYWGKIQLINQLTDAVQYREWVLIFTDSWSTMTFYLQSENGGWKQELNGSFTPDHLKGFVPTSKGNLVKLILPPNEVVTVYFRGISERIAIKPSFYVRLKHVDTFYQDLMNTKAGNTLFLGLLLMMFLYNLIAYFFGKDQSFIYYSVYLLAIAVYTTYSSEELIDWLEPFAQKPAYRNFIKLSLYIAMMSYLAFIRSFLDLKQLLPK